MFTISQCLKRKIICLRLLFNFGSGTLGIVKVTLYSKSKNCLANPKYSAILAGIVQCPPISAAGLANMTSLYNLAALITLTVGPLFMEFSRNVDWYCV